MRVLLEQISDSVNVYCSLCGSTPARIAFAV